MLAILRPSGRPVAVPTASASASATMIRRRPPSPEASGARPLTSYAPYDASGWNAIARFDGIVHGVVVQISTLTSRPASAGSRDASNVSEADSGNSTKIEGDV